MQAWRVEARLSAAEVGRLDEWSSDMERCDMGMMCDYATAGEGGHPTDRCRERVSFDFAVKGATHGSTEGLAKMSSCAHHLSAVLSAMVGKYQQQWVLVTRR